MNLNTDVPCRHHNFTMCLLTDNLTDNLMLFLKGSILRLRNIMMKQSSATRMMPKSTAIELPATQSYWSSILLWLTVRNALLWILNLVSHKQNQKISETWGSLFKGMNSVDFYRVQYFYWVSYLLHCLTLYSHQEFFKTFAIPLNWMQ